MSASRSTPFGHPTACSGFFRLDKSMSVTEQQLLQILLTPADKPAFLFLC